MPKHIAGRNFLLREYVKRTWSMWSIARMTVARFGVEHKKYSVASFRTYYVCVYYSSDILFSILLTLRTLWSCPTISHSSSVSSRSHKPSSRHCMTRLIALWCSKAYSSKLSIEFHWVATSLGIKVTVIQSSFKISFHAGRAKVEEFMIL